MHLKKRYMKNSIAKEYENEKICSCSSWKPSIVISGVRFDIAYNDTYDENEIKKLVEDAFANNEAYVTAVDFYEVDYSDYPNYKDKNTVQVGADFEWDSAKDYNDKQITKEIEDGLDKLGLEFLGIDFHSLD